MMAYVFVEPAMLVQEGGWLALLIALSVKGALILSLAAMTALVLRRAAAASRHLVWSLALASLLVLPLLSVALPAWQWSVFPDEFLSHESLSATTTPSPAAIVVEKPALAARADAAPATAGVHTNDVSAAQRAGQSTRSFDALKSGTTSEADHNSPVASATAAAPIESSVAYEAQSLRNRSLWGWIQWAMIGWLAGAALIVAHLFVGVARIWQLARRAETVRDADWLMLVERLSRRIALTQTVALRRSARVTMPMACGLFRSSILLPADADDWSRERREVVLLHELAHVKRRDCLTQLMAQVACAIYWFNPLVWMATRRLRIERERACDDQVLDAGAKASDYADHLLDIARSMGAAPSALVAAVAIARRSQLEGRLLAILDPRLRRRALDRATVTFIAIVMLSLVLPLAMLRPAANAQTKRARPVVARPPAAPQAPGAPVVASPTMAPTAPLMAAPPEAALAPAEPGAFPEAVLALPAELPGTPEAAPMPPAIVAAPQSPAPAAAPQAPLSQQDKDALVEAFQEALKDNDPEMREQALFALVQIGGPRATEAIVAALKDQNPEVREKAVWALGMRHGEGLVDPLIAALKDANPGVREKAAWALGMKGDGRAVDALVAALRDENNDVREKAAWALGLKGNKGAVEPLIEALKDKSADVRATAAWALGLRGDARAIKALNAATKDENRDVRAKALWALGMLLMRSGEATTAGDNDNDNNVDVDDDDQIGSGVGNGVGAGVGSGVGAGVGVATSRERKVLKSASGSAYRPKAKTKPR
jgi:HEAT repeat protein/beta-lactamase regulating signal transducer with metallopeptidase domain